MALLKSLDITILVLVFVSVSLGFILVQHKIPSGIRRVSAIFLSVAFFLVIGAYTGIHLYDHLRFQKYQIQSVDQYGFWDEKGSILKAPVFFERKDQPERFCACAIIYEMPRDIITGSHISGGTINLEGGGQCISRYSLRKNAREYNLVVCTKIPFSSKAVETQIDAIQVSIALEGYLKGKELVLDQDLFSKRYSIKDGRRIEIVFDENDPELLKVTQRDLKVSEAQYFKKKDLEWKESFDTLPMIPLGEIEGFPPEIPLEESTEDQV